jgi:hypothetical protein
MKKVIILLALAPSLALAANFSGVWSVTGEVADHGLAPLCTLKQADRDISGSCKLDSEHSVSVKGFVKGKEVTWSFDVDHQDVTYTLTFTGVLESDRAMKGTISVTPSDSTGEFTAKLQ